MFLLAHVLFRFSGHIHQVYPCVTYLIISDVWRNKIEANLHPYRHDSEFAVAVTSAAGKYQILLLESY